MNCQHEQKHDDGGLEKARAPLPEISPSPQAPADADILRSKKEQRAQDKEIPALVGAIDGNGITPFIIESRLDVEGR